MKWAVISGGPLDGQVVDEPLQPILVVPVSPPISFALDDPTETTFQVENFVLDLVLIDLGEFAIVVRVYRRPGADLTLEAQDAILRRVAQFFVRNGGPR